jgi:dUTP pyrophosphatase
MEELIRAREKLVATLTVDVDSLALDKVVEQFDEWMETTTKAVIALIDKAIALPPLHVKLLRYGAKAPVRMTPRSAGVDLHACLDTAHQTIEIPYGQRAMISTGIAVKIPEGYEGQCRPRSGLALNHGITVLNTPGTIDEDYVGEMAVILINHGASIKEPFVIHHGDRIAQLVITPVLYASVVVVEELPTTMRGADGFGSTGR